MNHDPEGIARAAQTALLYEAVTHPKPGLVDVLDSGAHDDMDIFTFIDSAVSLRGYFKQAALCGARFEGDDPTALFARLRELGMDAERTMFTATHGVNTHKGAVFSLGVSAGAAGYWCRDHAYCAVDIQRVIRSMLVGLAGNDFQKARRSADASVTAGERQFALYGLKGIRGEAERGFPTVIDVALPFLRSRSGSLNARLLDTLMMLAAHTQDSNLIKRAGTPDVLEWIKTQSDRYFALGGAGGPEGIRFLEELNETCIERNLSLGGCADLLILTIFFALLEGAVRPERIE